MKETVGKVATDENTLYQVLKLFYFVTNTAKNDEQKVRKDDEERRKTTMKRRARPVCSDGYQIDMSMMKEMKLSM